MRNYIIVRCEAAISLVCSYNEVSRTHDKNCQGHSVCLPRTVHGVQITLKIPCRCLGNTVRKDNASLCSRGPDVEIFLQEKFRVQVSFFYSDGLGHFFIIDYHVACFLPPTLRSSLISIKGHDLVGRILEEKGTEIWWLMGIKEFQSVIFVCC